MLAGRFACGCWELLALADALNSTLWVFLPLTTLPHTPARPGQDLRDADVAILKAEQLSDGSSLAPDANRIRRACLRACVRAVRLVIDATGRTKLGQE